MSLEGRLRELALSEVLQLLSLGRKTGTLALHATLDARVATIVVENGWIVEATDDGAADQDATRGEQLVAERVLDLLQWTDGEFRFTPHDVAADRSRARLSTDMLLMESARRQDAWSRLAPLVTSTTVVPTFPDVQPRQLSLLHLAPDQWEILTRVDGARTIADLAESLRQDVVDVATTVHGLIEAGVLTTAKSAPVSSPRTTIPPVFSPTMPFALPYEAGEDDSLFDPMQVGVMTPDGMPATYPDMADVSGAARSVTHGAPSQRSRRATVDTSGHQDKRRNAAMLLRAGDRAAREGRLENACAYWQQCLDSGVLSDDLQVDAVRERIALGRRLSALLNS